MSDVTTALSAPQSEQPAQPSSATPAVVAPPVQASQGSPPPAQQPDPAQPPQQPSGDAKSPPQEALQFDRWRELLAGGDDKVLAELTRIKSPADLGRQLMHQKQELSKRAQPVVLGKDATPEQIASYREAVGVPKEASIEAYGIKAPDGYTMTEVDKQALGDFAKDMHDMHVAPGVVQKAAERFFAVQQENAKALAKIDNDRGQEWTEARQQERGRDDKALLAASVTYLDNHPWIKAQPDPAAAKIDLMHARLPGGGLVGDHPLIHALLADAALRGGYGDRIMANELESGGGKSLAEQQREIEKLQFTDRARYGAPETQSRLDRIIAARIARGEIDENGNESRRRVA